VALHERAAKHLEGLLRRSGAPPNREVAARGDV
jgi:hypothetical protein